MANKYTGNEWFANANQVETQKFRWGTLQWTMEPRICGTDNMTGGIVTLLPGDGHDEHTHDCCELLYMIDGQDCEQYMILEDGTRISQLMQPGDFAWVPKGVPHGTVNGKAGVTHLVAVYQFPGSEADLGKQADEIIPPAE